MSTLVLNGKEFSLPKKFKKIGELPDKIYNSLTDGDFKYKIDSNVKYDSLDSFIQYLINGTIPEVTISNFSDLNQLAQEFDQTEISSIIKDKIAKWKEYENKLGQLDLLDASINQLFQQFGDNINTSLNAKIVQIQADLDKSINSLDDKITDIKDKADKNENDIKALKNNENENQQNDKNSDTTSIKNESDDQYSSKFTEYDQKFAVFEQSLKNLQNENNNQKEIIDEQKKQIQQLESIIVQKMEQIKELELYRLNKRQESLLKFLDIPYTFNKRLGRHTEIYQLPEEEFKDYEISQKFLRQFPDLVSDMDSKLSLLINACSKVFQPNTQDAASRTQAKVRERFNQIKDRLTTQ